MRSSFLYIAPLICLALGCQDSGTALDQSQAISAASGDNRSLVFDFTKGDQSDTATLRDPISTSELHQLKGRKPQVLPIYLNAGDQVSLGLWSDQEAQAIIYQPESVSGRWLRQETQAMTAAIKSGLDRAELSLTALSAGEYAIVLLPGVSETEFLLTTTCVGGPCRDRLLQAEEEAIREEREATSIPEAPIQ